MRKIIALILSFTLCISSFPIIYENEVGATSSELFQIVEINGKKYIVDNEGAYYSEFHTASGDKLTIENGLQILQNNVEFVSQQESRGPVAPEDAEPGTLTITSYNLNYEGTDRKVTADVFGPGTITYGESVTITDSISFSGNASTTIKNIVIGKIELQFGINWETSLSSSSSFSVEFDVSSGMKGAIYFTPYYRRFSGGYVHTDLIYYKGVFMTPKKTDAGFADGVYWLKEWSV